MRARRPSAGYVHELFLTVPIAAHYICPQFYGYVHGELCTKQKLESSGRGRACGKTEGDRDDSSEVRNTTPGVAGVARTFNLRARSESTSRYGNDTWNRDRQHG